MIQTENYILEKMKLEYVNETYLSWFNNSEIKNYIGFNPKNTFICNIRKFRKQNPTTIGVAWWSRLSK